MEILLVFDRTLVLNGMPMPEQLPPELVPPSAQDLGTTILSLLVDSISRGLVTSTATMLGLGMSKALRLI